ncbi:His-Xaa-Ser system-associated MauG-like protein [Kordiimonas gwangyangensis]|uniref:His-Xaa-Ser system-associated MauG-like protein n=1 Tax=Kordiimonas gwangyangensis TaxID=288022 RepID=UPI00037B6831|nr:His-Xaa-Ser system-associated MauG-like protein [Kordiimonas gwangyangensis]
MNFGTRVSVIASLVVFCSCDNHASQDTLRERILKDRAIESGLTPVEALTPAVDPGLAAAGQKLFEAEYLSLNSKVSCRSCHLPQFSSADGLPNAIGVRGKGEGISRLSSGGAIVPRNTLPLWGRGSVGFDTFFWDGKVERKASSGVIVSQFGTVSPSDDPLVVAVHLPPVEFREMLDDLQADVLAYETETTESAEAIYQLLAGRIREDKPLATELAHSLNKDPEELSFEDAAMAIAAFIRTEFRIRETDFHRFVFGQGELSEDAIDGGLIFYGKGQCSMCHNGPFFSDLDFHAIPMPQLGFGKNGFGVDYGRYNVTFAPADRYRFRTPPLYNVQHTAPYSHSGSLSLLQDVIAAHLDPLALLQTQTMNSSERQEFYGRLLAWSGEAVEPIALSDREIADLVAFLKALSFCAPPARSSCTE